MHDPREDVHRRRETRRLRFKEVLRLERDPLGLEELLVLRAPDRARAGDGLRAVLHDEAEVRVRERNVDGDGANPAADVDDEGVRREVRPWEDWER